MNDLLNCKHRNMRFLSGMKSIEERHDISVCKDCGLIKVTGWKDGVPYKVTFHINDTDTLAALAQWTLWINEESA